MNNASENMIKDFRAFSAHLMFLLEGRINDESAEIKTVSENLNLLIEDYQYYNPWYPANHIRYALNTLSLACAGIDSQVTVNRQERKGKKIAFLMKPGAPLEGIGEVLLAAMSGFHCLVSLGDEDIPLFRGVLKLAGCYLNGIDEKIEMINGRLPAFDACIGVNTPVNPSVERYFSKHPFLHISNKGSAAILTGGEPAVTLSLLADDICMYFGRSMYSLKTLFVPEGYDFGPLMARLDRYSESGAHSRYFNHYEYRKAGMLINQIKHLDNGFLLVTDEISQIGFIGVLHYTYYNSQEDVLTSGILKDYPLAGIAGIADNTVAGLQSVAVKRIFGHSSSLDEFFRGI